MNRIKGNYNSSSITSASGIFDLSSQNIYRLEDAWPTSNIVTNGLQVYLDAANSTSYPGSGNIWYDLSGNGRNATMVGTPTFTTNYFTGFTDANYFTMSTTNLSPRTNDFTYSMWTWFDSTDTYDTLFELGSYADSVLWRYQSGTTFALYLENTSGTFSWTRTLSTWYNVVVSRRNGIVSLYINNVLTGTPFTLATDANIANANLFIGRSQHTTAQSINGRISTFQIYNRALTSDEIIQNYYAQKKNYGL